MKVPPGNKPAASGTNPKRRGKLKRFVLRRKYNAACLSASLSTELEAQLRCSDNLIPFSLRTLADAERELCHEGLTFAVIAAEWSYRDLVIWMRHPAEYSRQTCWKNIGIALDWIKYLDRKLTARC